MLLSRSALYGFDLTGGDPANKADLYLGAPKAISAALDVCDRGRAQRSRRPFRSGLAPLIPRFTPLRFKEYAPQKSGVG